MAQLKDSLVAGDLRVTGKIYGTATNSDRVNNLTVLTAVPANAKFTDTTYSSKTAASGGTEVSLVTTGEKYTWNNKSNLAIGTTASTAAAGNHTHSTSIATSTGTNQLSLSANTKYAITAGGTSFIFTTPVDNNTTYSSKTAASGGTDVSLVTTGEKYTWNNKSNLSIGTSATTAAAGNHAHGNITNGGDITTTATIASGDRLVINDESASKVTNSSITFGTDTTTFLRNDGTWAAAGGGGDPLDAYPVGSIYISVNNTSPATLFGGTWSRIEDRFLLAATNPSASTVTYPVGSVGGAATVTLTTNQIPSHYHSYTNTVRTWTPGGDFAACYREGSANTGNTGGGQAHENMPPYLAVYMWQRTA